MSLEKNVEFFAGEDVSQRVMESSEEISEKTDKIKVAMWVKGAMERLDSMEEEKKRVQIMENCGFSCFEVNRRVFEKALSRRKKFGNIDEFLEAEQRSPMVGTRLLRKGNNLHQFYTPKSFKKPMRCYCALLRGLPENQTVSETYCHCARGFVKKFWEGILEKPVRVELKRSAVRGSEECEFVIYT